MKTILCLHSSADLYGSDRSLLRLVTGGLPHRFIVVLPYEGPLCDALRGSGAKAGKCEGAKVEVVVFPLAVVRRSLMSPVGLVRLGWGFLRTVWFLRKLIAGKNVDLVLANTTAVLGGEVAAWLTGVPYYQYVREIIVSPRLVAKFFSWRARLADTVICVSHGTRNAFIAHCPQIAERTIVVNNGLEVEKYEGAKVRKFEGSSSFLVPGSLFREELGVSQDTVLIGAIGRISKFKGMDFFVASAARLIREKPGLDVYFVVVGSAFREAEAVHRSSFLVPGSQEELLPAEKELLEQIEKAGLGQKCQWLPFREDIVEVMHGLDVFVLPSMLPDPFPTVVLEAMICGKPVIGTNHGGVPEMISAGNHLVESAKVRKCESSGLQTFIPSHFSTAPTGLLVSPGDTAALAEAMGVLVENPELRRAMGEAGRKRCLENFTRDIYLERIAEVLGGVRAEGREVGK